MALTIPPTNPVAGLIAEAQKKAKAIVMDFVSAPWESEPEPAKDKGASPKPVQTINPTTLTKFEAERPLVKSILNILDGEGQNSIERLSFETDPTHNHYAGLYKQKLRGLPDIILKRIAIQDDLVATIVNTRSNHTSAFARPLVNRFEKGFQIEPKKGVTDSMSPEQKEALQKKIDKAIKLLVSCGHTEGYDGDERMTFSQYLYMTTRNALVFGRSATEIVWAETDDPDKPMWHSFRPIDAGTIYNVNPFSQSREIYNLRKEAITQLKQLKAQTDSDFDWDDLLKEDEDYRYLQVIEGQPKQAYTARECMVHNFYPVTDIEMDGYPLTPIDTMVAAVTTHINITTHNKLYFQSGRASKGMLVLKSDDVNPTVIQRIKQQFQASINGVSNSWRMPVFGIGKDDDITFEPIDQGSRDMEFQYLSDQNCRVILSAFGMSPDELPGYNHLSKGSNSQSLSEANNEFKLEAARDVGIRPLLRQLEDTINGTIIPLIDEEVAELCKFQLVGLDADTPEKEATRLSEQMPISMTMDEVLEKVEKDPVGKEWGGDFLFNEAYQNILNSYFLCDEIRLHFFNKKPDPNNPDEWHYARDQFYQGQQQRLDMLKQAAQQAAQPQPGAPGQPPAGGGGQQPPPSGGQQQPPATGAPEGSTSAGSVQPTPAGDGENAPSGGGDISSSLDQIAGALGKSEDHLPASRQRLLGQQKKAVKGILEAFEKDANDFLKLASQVVAESKKD